MLVPPGQQLLISWDESGKDQGILLVEEKDWICFADRLDTFLSME